MLPIPQNECFQELTEDTFKFACHPEVPCFNQCCRKLSLVLTPYDVLRLKIRLGMTGKEFLDRYTSVEAGQNGWPMPKLWMEGEEETCPFLTGKGCSVYEDRPGACRTYPLGRATRRGKDGAENTEDFFLVKEPHCRGFEEGPDWTPEDWTKDQGLELYNEINDLFMPILTRQCPDMNPDVIAQKMRMMFMACYHLESFKNLLTKSRLTELFDVDAERVQLMLQEELELLKFAFEWCRFSFFGEPILQVRPEVAEKRKLKWGPHGMPVA